jgi:hypothetical protein
VPTTFIMMRGQGGVEIAVNPDHVLRVEPSSRAEFAFLVFDPAKANTIAVEGTVAEAAERLAIGGRFVRY